MTILIILTPIRASIVPMRGVLPYIVCVIDSHPLPDRRPSPIRPTSLDPHIRAIGFFRPTKFVRNPVHVGYSPAWSNQAYESNHKETLLSNNTKFGKDSPGIMRIRC